MTKPSRTTNKLLTKNCMHYSLILVLALVFTFGPGILGLNATVELGIVVAVCGFIGKLGKIREIPFFTMMPVCTMIGIGIIIPGVLVPEFQYQSVSFLGPLGSLFAGAFLGFIIAFIQYIAE